MNALRRFGLSLAALLAGTALARAESITIATVNNDDMIIMQKLSSEWEKQTGNKANWVILEENTLRQRVTTDISTKGGQFDVVTIGAYETPIWGKRGWLTKLDDFDKSYDYDDLLTPVRDGLTVDGSLYAVPFYAESSFTLYRKDIFEKAGLTMPAQPSWDQIAQFADKLTDKSKDQYGVCLRGKPGWGENMGLITTIANTFGGRWFDMKWQPQLTSEPWEKAGDLLRRPASSRWPARRVGQRLQRKPVALRLRPMRDLGRCHIGRRPPLQQGDLQGRRRAGLRAGADRSDAEGRRLVLGLVARHPGTTTKQEAAAKSFVAMGDLQGLREACGRHSGWVAAPPGTRKSTYESPEYKKAAPFADMVYSRSCRLIPPSRPCCRSLTRGSSSSRSPSSRPSARTSGRTWPRPCPARRPRRLHWRTQTERPSAP